MRTRRLLGMIDSRANCENSPLGIFLVEKMSFENRGSQLQASLGEKRKDMSTLFAHVAWRILSCHWQNLLWESTCWANSFSHSSRFAVACPPPSSLSANIMTEISLFPLLPRGLDEKHQVFA